MHFLVIAYDGTDDDALNRRMASRKKHLELNIQLKDKGNMLYGGAIVDDDGKMIGSSLVCQFTSKKELDKWLKEEPYITGNVWEKIEVHPFKIAPAYL